MEFYYFEQAIKELPSDTVITAGVLKDVFKRIEELIKEDEEEMDDENV